MVRSSLEGCTFFDCTRGKNGAYSKKKFECTQKSFVESKKYCTFAKR